MDRKPEPAVFFGPEAGGFRIAKFWPEGGGRIARSQTESSLEKPWLEP